MRSLLVLSLTFAVLCATQDPPRKKAPTQPLGITRSNAILQSLALQKKTKHGFVLKAQQVDDLGMEHYKYTQLYKDTVIPIFGGEAIAHLKNNDEQFVTDGLLEIADIDPKPVLTEEQALDVVYEVLGRCPKGSCVTGEYEVELVVLPSPQPPRLAYRVRVNVFDTHGDIAVIFVDAITGVKLWQYSDLQTQTTNATGPSYYSGTVTFNSYQVGSTYYMEDTVNRVGVQNMAGSTSTGSRMTDADGVFDSVAQRPGCDAIYAGAKYNQFLLERFSRKGLNDNFGPTALTSIDGITRLILHRVNYGTKYNNAFWDGAKCTYGNGDNVTFSPLVSADIVGHELAHGIVSSTANLVYSGESGALNEATADIFAAQFEEYLLGDVPEIWLIGEQVYTPSTPGDALRYMNNPQLAGDPDHYSTRYTGSQDNGGVHINSGIANYFFYLLTKGGTHRLGGVVNGIGIIDAGKIWYRALVFYMTSSTNFAAARTACLFAANDLFGSNSTQYNETARAWNAVGVTGPNPTFFSNGGFETEIFPWVISGTGVSYLVSGSNPQNGTGYITIGGNGIAGQVYQQTTVPTSALTLRFSLRITPVDPSRKAVDRLFVELRSTTGTLLTTLATYSNLNVASTYVTRSLSLASTYRGQTLRVQFRGATDASVPTTFFVDSVSFV